jgi:hypothetical protein
MIFNIFNWLFGLFGKKEEAPKKQPARPHLVKSSQTGKMIKIKESQDEIEEITDSAIIGEESSSSRVIMPDDKQDRFGAILLKYNMISYENLHKALRLQNYSKPRRFLGEILIEEKMISEESLVSALSRQFKIPYVKVEKYSIPKEVLKLITKDIARKHLVIPLNKIGQLVTVGMANPQDFDAIEELRKITGCKIKIVICKISEIKDVIQTNYEAPELQVSNSSQQAVVDTKRESVNKNKSIQITELKFPKSPLQAGKPGSNVTQAKAKVISVPSEAATIQKDQRPETASPVAVEKPLNQTQVIEKKQEDISPLTEEQFSCSIKEISAKSQNLWEEKYHRDKPTKAEAISEEEFDFLKSLNDHNN